jgi:predicted phage baseplate assembly protein
MPIASSSNGCRCDLLDFPPKPRIPAGLSALPRQLAGFPEFRLAMLRQIPAHVLMDAAEFPLNVQRPLRNWRAREGDDLGIMLLEMWAYVLDVLAFYDERIANEGYLQTAVRPVSLQELIALIGYLPRPAIGSEVTLALFAETGKGLVSVPIGTGFRSGAFAGEKPQIFEADEERTIDPALNEWTLAPIRSLNFDGRFILPTSDARLTRADLALFTWGNSGAAAARVRGAAPSQRLDGNTYIDLDLDPEPSIGADVELDDIAVWKPTARSGVSSVASARTIVELDSLQSAVRVGDHVIIQRGATAEPFKVTNIALSALALSLPPGVQALSPRAVQPFLNVTKLTITPALPSGWQSPLSSLSVHFGMVRAGSLTSPAQTRLNVDDLFPSAPFEMPVEPPTLQPSGSVLLAGADGSGANLAASVSISADDGTGSVTPQQSAEPFATDLRTPVTTFGNLIHATRGESVPNEVLGSGDAKVAFQAFKLKKKPLTYLNDESAPNGRRSTLAVRVNAILWSEVGSFFGAGPQDEVYIVRQNEDGESIVTFGDGQTGVRLPSGVKNVTASYRFGAGAAKPPANLITQMSRPVPGIRRVVNPVGAGGGADADEPKDLRRNAPESALLLGRAVSLPDFEALAGEFGGVVNARATWAWDGTMQRAVVAIRFISDGGSIAIDLRRFLLGQSDPNTPLAVSEAVALESSLTVDLIVDSRFQPDDVEQAVAIALTEPEKGLLALENIPIGLPLFRSAILEQVHAVAGVVSVRALRFNGSEAPFGIAAGEGEYHDFSTGLVVGNTAAGDALFAPGT